ncbi:MAG: c-type cytochrome [Solirubrobacteraceae bacterium]
MLAILVFIAFWVVLAGGLFLVGRRGSNRTAAKELRPPGSTRVGRLAFNASIAIIYVAFIAVVPAIMLIGNHDNASAKIGNVTLTSAEKQGRVLFGAHCSICHTLAAANAVGKVGPNLDQLQPSEALILHTLANGCLADPPSATAPTTCLGEGTMPADVVEGKQAQQVAAFVAAVAGHE